MDTLTATDWISDADIAGPLRRMAGAGVRLTGGWTCEQFKASMGQNLGVWRVSGMMRTAEGDQPWAMVLKGWDCTDRSGSPTSFNWPWREADLYRSGVLDDLPGVSAPACFGARERDGRVWVWLEDLTVHPQPAWTVERFAAVARSLGHFNGSYLAGRPIPDHPSLSRRWLEGWVDFRSDMMAALDDHLDDQRIAAVIPPDVAAASRRIWDRRAVVLERLRSLPQGFAHLDAFAQNVFFRPAEDDAGIVLIDWSFAGRAAPGEELAALGFASAGFDPAVLAILDDVEAAIVPAYIGGLRDAGWSGDEAGVFDTYRTTVTLRYVAAALTVALAALESPAAHASIAGALGTAPEGLFAHLAGCGRWIAERAEDA